MAYAYPIYAMSFFHKVSQYVHRLLLPPSLHRDISREVFRMLGIFHPADCRVVCRAPVARADCDDPSKVRPRTSEGAGGFPRTRIRKFTTIEVFYSGPPITPPLSNPTASPSVERIRPEVQYCRRYGHGMNGAIPKLQPKTRGTRVSAYSVRSPVRDRGRATASPATSISEGKGKGDSRSRQSAASWRQSDSRPVPNFHRVGIFSAPSDYVPSGRTSNFISPSLRRASLVRGRGFLEILALYR